MLDKLKWQLGAYISHCASSYHFCSNCSYHVCQWSASNIILESQMLNAEWSETTDLARPWPYCLFPEKSANTVKRCTI
ncbi:hypothetical protein Plhal304r1_c019g0068521 [Plasmopara halstedii]